MLPEKAFQPRNGRMGMTLESGGGPSHTTSTVTQSSIPDWLRPQTEALLGAGMQEYFQTEKDASGNYNITGVKPYKPYSTDPRDYFAGFTPQQQNVMSEAAGMQTPGQFGTASGLAQMGGMQALQAGQYQPGQFNFQGIQAPTLNQYQMGPAMGVSSQQVRAPTMETAQTGFNPQLERFQMAAPQQFGGAQAQQYMDPYMQQVVNIQKQNAIEDAQRTQLGANLGAARQGTYGGARQLLAQGQREAALGKQLSDIQATGSQAAFQQAQQQFERDRAAGMTAQQRNLEAALGVQQLGTQTGLQASLANLSAAQQANVQNQSAQLQAMGMNQEQALRAALANQQAGLTVGQQNLQALLQTQQLGTGQSMEAQRANQQAMLEAQKMAEQSRQFGSDLGLRGAGQAVQAGQALGQLGTQQQQADLARMQFQQQMGAMPQELQQQIINQAIQNFALAQESPFQRLAGFSGLLRGYATPTTTVSQYQAQPSSASQLAGLGALAYGAGMPGKKKGGEIKDEGIDSLAITKAKRKKVEA
jgi:hypothetical protein